jgi:hypothetical protein
MEDTLVFVTREEFLGLKQQVVELERRLSVFVSRYRHVATGELAAADDYLQRPRTLETRESKAGRQ